MAVGSVHYFSLWLINGGEPTVRSFGGTVPDWAFQFVSKLPLYHEEPDYILVHAGLKPGVPLQEQTEKDLLWVRDEFIHGYIGKTVVFGHTPVRLLHDKWEPWFGDSKIGIDTGAVFGGCLTVLDLDTFETWTA